jgi:hypothetical protein
MQHPDKHTCNNTSKNTNETFGTNLRNICVQHCNIYNILIYLYNIHLKQLQHTSKTSETPDTNAYKMYFKHIATSPCCLQNIGSPACGVHRRQLRCCQHQPDGLCLLEAAGDPFVVIGIVGSTRGPLQPCRWHSSPHHYRISRRAVDLVEGAARQSGAEARGTRCR